MNEIVEEGGTKVDELLTMKELSDKLKISRVTIERMMRSGKLPFLKVGIQYRFIVGDVMKALRQNTASGLVNTLR